MDVLLPVPLTGVKESVSILALVCPEPQGPQQVPVIIGTNASFFQRLTMLRQDSGVSNHAHSLRIQSSLLKPCFQRVKGKEEVPESADGQVKWKGPGVLTIPSQGENYAVCKVECEKPLRKDIFLVETPMDSHLPAGLFIPPTVMSSSAIDVNHFRVLVCNATSKDIRIPTDTVIAKVFATDTVTVTPDAPIDPKRIDPSVFKFGDSPIPAAWEKRLRKKLAEHGNVFSLEEWDVGRAKGVKHIIRLSDSRPFRERSRRVAPADIDDVKATP